MLLFWNLVLQLKFKYLIFQSYVCIFFLRADHSCNNTYSISNKASTNSFGSVLSFKTDMSSNFCNLSAALKEISNNHKSVL